MASHLGSVPVRGSPGRLYPRPRPDVTEPVARAGKEPEAGIVNDGLDGYRDFTWDTIDPVKKPRPLNE